LHTICCTKHVFYAWQHQKLNVVQQLEKQHAHEKEMQQQKLQQEKKQGQDVDVVHLQEVLQEEEQREKLLVEEEQREKLLVEEEQREKLLVEEEQREDDADLFSFFLIKI